MLNAMDLTPEQSKEIINVHQLFEVYQERMAHADHFKGSMTWKNIKGNDYLYKKNGDKNRSLGVRSPDTEHQFNQFSSGKGRFLIQDVLQFIRYG